MVKRARRPDSVSREWLEEQYVTLGRSCREIGADLGKDGSTVRLYLLDSDIPTRPRGAVTSGSAFKKGEPSAFKGHKHTDAARELLRQACLADGRVPYLVNGQPYMRGRTGASNPHWKGGATPERQAFYRSNEWKAACKAVWHRANACCERCGADYRTVRREHGPKFHVHHIVSFAVRELRAVVSNLVLLCAGCHRFVHSRANAGREFLAPDLLAAIP